MRTRIAAAVALALAGSLALALIALGSGRDDRSSCYPNNLVQLGAAPGTFRASSEGRGSEPGGSISWDVNERFTPTGLDGSLEATIRLSGERRTMRFESTCIAEAQVEDDGGAPSDQIVETEFEGLLYGAPKDWNTGYGPVKVVASLLVSGQLNQDDGSASTFSFNVEQGTTCSENEDKSFKLAGSAKGDLSIRPAPASGATSGIAGLPTGYTGSSCPGFEDESEGGAEGG
jgi:hypothetical protein